MKHSPTERKEAPNYEDTSKSMKNMKIQISTLEQPTAILENKLVYCYTSRYDGRIPKYVDFKYSSIHVH